MPINQDGAYESVRFQYQHEQDETFTLNIEFHHTDIGPTITLHNLLDTGPLALPLSVYVDIVDYLRGRGSIPGGSTLRPSGGVRLPPTRVVSSPQVAQRPVVQKQPQVAQQQQPQAPVSMREVEEVQNTYSPLHNVLMAGGNIDTTPTRPAASGPIDFGDVVDRMNEPLPTVKEGLAKRASAPEPKKTMKRIVKPGEPEYLDPPT